MQHHSFLRNESFIRAEWWEEERSWELVMGRREIVGTSLVPKLGGYLSNGMTRYVASEYNVQAKTKPKHPIVKESAAWKKITLREHGHKLLHSDYVALN